MKESFEESAMLPVVALFTLFFISFLCLMINYYKCFKMKNEAISIIEKYNGSTNSDEAWTIINNYLNASNYTGTGTCKTGYTQRTTTKGAIYCTKKNNVHNSFLVNYNVQLFYSLNFFGSNNNFITFTVNGTTIDLNDEY